MEQNHFLTRVRFFGALSPFRLFWHQLMRKAFTSHASYVVQHALRISRGNKLSRPLILAFSFLVVAAMHIVADPHPSMCLAWLQLRYYANIVLAIAGEEVAVKLWTHIIPPSRPQKTALRLRRANGHREAKKQSRDNGSNVAANNERHSTDLPKRRWLGYLWVIAFNTWSASKLVYAATRC